MQLFFSTFGDSLLNKKSISWKKLSEHERNKNLLDLIIAYPTLMKRPVIDLGTELVLGWNPKKLTALGY